MNDRVDALAERARADAAGFEPPADPPDEEQAMAFLREGVGQAVKVYVDARGDAWHRFEPATFERLEGAMNTWLELYAACYGVEMDAEFTVREAAELFVETHNVADVAQLLTHVPERNCGE